MDKSQLLESIKKARESLPKRNFSQKFDLIINLKQINLKKPEENINTFIALPHSPGKEIKTCALVDQELVTKAKEACDLVIPRSDFLKYDAKAVKKLASKYNYFLAQSNIMPDIAKTFGKVLGTRGLMPNPKSGAVVPPALLDLKPVVQKIKNTVKVQNKNEPAVKVLVGNEKMKDEEIAENITLVYNTVLHSLPQEKNNIKSILIKLTMGKPVEVAK